MAKARRRADNVINHGRRGNDNSDMADYHKLVDCLLFTITLAFFDSLSASAAECSADKKKECPGLHEKHDQIACCPSKVETGDYYCCTLEEKRRSEYSWRNELIESTPEIVGGVIATLLLVFTLVLVFCFFCKCCYLHQYRHRRRHDSMCRTSISNEERRPSSTRVHSTTTQPLIGASYQQSYQPVPVLEPPKPYEAPPPYPFAQRYPSFNPSGLTSTLVPRNHGFDYGQASASSSSSFRLIGTPPVNHWSPKLV